MSEAASMGIAVVGLAGRFPGARDVEAFWRNLRDGVESITFFTDEELLAAGVDPGLLREPGYVRAGSVLDDPAMFDAGFFGIHRREAELMDPQHRFFLECAWEALENAGYDPEQYPGAIGVYAGMRVNTYLLSNLVSGREFLDGMLHFRSPHAFLTYLCSDKDFLTSRVAYKLNLRGPAVTVQTACSTSLVAVCQACESLLAYSSDMVLAGGSSITFPQVRGYLAQEGGMVSSDGHTRSFDAKAQGTVFGSGVGIVVLKRLEDAVADGDTIHAVIKGFALNNDGSKKVSYTAPAIDGQAEVVSLAQAVAGISAGTIGYLEAHGTATPLGEPIEVAALTQAFRETTEKTGYCAIGSAKSNLGHLDSAAGITGLIKAVLAIERGEIPPSLHYETPNPDIDFASSPFFVNTKLREWPRIDGAPRRGGVSSFGVGGTNAHVVIEEAPALAARIASPRPQLLLLSARFGAALEKATDRLAAHLRADPALDLADVAHTLRVGRRAFPHRRVLVARTATEAAALLEARDAKTLLDAADAPGGAPVTFLFPGQGAQSAGMGRGLCDAEPVFARAFDRCDELLRPLLGRGLLEVIDDAALLGETQFSQPAIFAFEYALAQLWMSWGIRPGAFAGHSVGEYVAACLAGVFSLEDALRLVTRRAQIVQALPRGAMLAVRLTEAELRAQLPAHLSIAAVNAPAICVVAGPEAVIAAFEQSLESAGVAARRLASSHAFHSAMVEPAVAPFTAEVEKIALHAPRIPFVSCVTGTWITAEDATSPAYWARHLRGTVRFAEAVVTLCADPAGVILEVGPSRTLAPLVRQHPARAANQPVIASIGDGKDEAAAVARALGQLWLAGVQPDWKSYVAHETRRRVPVPTYPFERERYWIEPPRMTGSAAPAALELPDTATAPHPAAPEAEVPLGALAELKALLTSLSGQNLDATPASATLLDLGFDSLFLTQVSTAIEKRFGAKITFRQLLGELGTLGALTAHLEAEPRLQNTVGQASRLSSGGVPPGKHSTGGTPAETGGTPVPLEIRGTPVPRSALVAHGPMRPVQRELSGAFTARQQTFLDGFITRYAAQTAGSKRYADAHRPHFADPRSIAGFKQAWKEIVYPLVVERSAGAKLWDIDGNAYIDVTCGFGTALFGHQPDFVTEAITAQLARGIEIGPTPPLAGEVAAMICEMTGMERAAFCNTGSEAVTGALRLARTVSGREKIVIFVGSYHGISDEVLVRASGPDDPHATPIAPGIPAEMSANVLVLEYGDPAALETIRTHARELAAVLVEPVQSRRPEFQPREFLHALRDITAAAGVALIFDEVISGFRAGPAGAQGVLGIRGDIATYGKVLGGGLPIGVIAGSAKYMDALDGGAWKFGDDSFPEIGVTFFAGTFARHPLALAAAKAVLTKLRAEPELTRRLAERTAAMIADLGAILAGTPFEVPHFSSSFHVRSRDFACSGLLFALLREKGIHIWENRPCFLSTAHTEADVVRIVAAFRESIAELRMAGFFKPQRAANEFPITDSQREIWLACQLDATAASSYNETWTLRLEGPLDVPALGAAVQEIVARHDALRSTVTSGGDTLAVSSETDFALPLVDLSDVPAVEHDAHFAELRAAEGRRAFDLAAGPLLALQLMRLAPESHALVFNAHHLVCDGWSCDVFLHELATIYSALRTGRRHALPPAMQMRDFQAWTEALAATPEFAADAAYWLRKYRALPERLSLPGDRPYPKSRTYRGASEVLVLPAGFAEPLAKLGARHGATLFSVLLAGFKTLLFRLTGQRDLAVGVPAAGQNLAGGDHLIGHCVNLLPLRTEIEGAQPFSVLLAEVQAGVLEAFEHQRVSFGWLVQRLGVPRDPARVPLVPVTFNLDPPLSHIAFDGLEHRLEANPRSAFQFDLGFNCDTGGAGFRIICHYNTDLFDAATIRHWMAEYCALLETAVADPTQPMDAFARHDLTAPRAIAPASGTGWKPTPLALPPPPDSVRPFPQCGVHWIFEQQAALTPDAVAVESEGQRLTYAQLNRRANQLAHILTARGLKPGACGAIALERSADFVVAALAILKAGAAYVPLDPAYPSPRLALMLDATQSTLLVTRELFTARLPMTRARVVILDALDLTAGDDTNPGTQGGADDLAYVMFTSGSTGEPKGVDLAHRGIARLVLNTDYAPLEPGDRVAFASNVCFDAATFEIWGALLNGGTVVVTPHETLLSAEALTAHLRSERITALFLTTSLFNQMAAISPAMFASVRLLLFGGEAADPQAVRRVLDAGPPDRLLNMYGPTEATTFATFHTITHADGPRIPIGRPITNTEAYILDEALAPAKSGELYLGGPGLALGYRGAPELTAQRFIETPHGRLYRTGDLACWLPDGAIDCLGRVDDQVKVRGFRVEPGEVEAILRQQPGVKDCRVVAVQEASQPRQLVAYFVSNGFKPEPAVLQGALARVLPGYMLPASFVSVRSFPLTPAGKLDVRALPSPGGAGAVEASSPGPRSEVEREVAAVWSELLGHERVGVTDDFFALGGHSLLGIRMIAALRERLDVDVPVRRLFEAPTVEAIARFIESVRPPARDFPSLVPLQRGAPGERPFFLVPGGWGGEIEFFVYTHIIRHIGADLPIYGLKARGTDGLHEPHRSVGEMAADYVTEVRARQPGGPYLLGGECIGGIVAYEMARQLEAAGEQVDLLVLLDTDVPTRRSYRDFVTYDRTERLRRLWETRVVQPARGHLQKLGALSLAGRWQYVLDRTLRRGARPAAEDPENEERRILADYPKILLSHRLQPYGGKVTLLIDEDSHRRFGQLGWQDAKVGGIEVHVLPGDHLSYIRANAKTAAAKLRELIEHTREGVAAC